MDAEERVFRQVEFDAQRKSIRNTALVAIASFVVSAVAVAVSGYFSSRSLEQSTRQFRANIDQSTEQFRLNARDAHYSVIVSGLSSSAAAVQTNSMWLLREFVEDPSNYLSRASQQDGARDAIQTLDAFIEDNSATKDHTGLTYYESPQPIILSRAMFTLKALDSSVALGSHDADVSRGNFHGLSLPYFAPHGSFLAVATDFRRANLSHLDLRSQPSSLDDAFLTCANLTDAHFAATDFFGTDLTGADLSGADLRHVTDLTSMQLRGVTISSKTHLPPNVHANGAAWGASSPRCANLVDRMTGMHGGQGYSSSHPCPADLAAAERLRTDPPFDGSLTDLVAACAMRNS